MNPTHDSHAVIARLCILPLRRVIGFEPFIEVQLESATDFDERVLAAFYARC
jgi:hypothetical protein